MSETLPYILYFQESLLIGINRTYLDYLLRCSKSEFKDPCKKTYEKLDMSENEETSFTFSSINTHPKPDDVFVVDQPFYHQCKNLDGMGTRLNSVPCAPNCTEGTIYDLFEQYILTSVCK